MDKPSNSDDVNNIMNTVDCRLCDFVECDDILCYMKTDIINNPMYWLGASIFSGFLFATWSWGLAYLLVGLVIYEIGYYIFCRHRGSAYDMQMRVGIVAGAIMGFLIGRAITKTDNHIESFREFKTTVKRYIS